MPPRLRLPIALASVCCAIGLVAPTASSQSRWARLAPFPEPAEELYGATVNGKMYVLGGYGERIGKVFEYDPASDRWTKKKTMQLPVHHQAMVPYNGKIYIFGGFTQSPSEAGWTPVDNSWEYDPVADTWKALAPMPGKRGSAVVSEVGGKMYVIGGATMAPNSRDTAIFGAGPAMVLTRNQVYDPATDTWGDRAPMAVGRNHAYAGAVNGKIYVIGGRIGHAFVTVSSNSDIVEEYDPATDLWSGLKAKIPTPRSGGGWATHNGKIYVAGGEVATQQFVGAFRAVEVYDPAANMWSTMPSMPMPRHGVAGAVIGNRFHLVSGQITSAAAGGGLDPKLSLYTSLHDAIDLPH